MAERVVDLLELVEVEHHQRGAALGALEGVQRGIDPLLHPVAIGEPGQRIELGEAIGLFLAAEVLGHIDRASTEAEEIGVRVMQRLAGEFQHDVMLPIIGLDGEVGKALARVELEAERAAVPLAFDRDEQLLERRSGDALERASKALDDGRAQIDDTAIGIGRPETDRATALDFVDDGQLIGRIECRQRGAQGVVGRDFALALLALEKVGKGHCPHRLAASLNGCNQ